MNTAPPYFAQEHDYTCSLAVFRMVLAQHGLAVTERQLITTIQPDYGTHFRNVWNPTLAKLAGQYGLKTTMYALWPLFRPEVIHEAIEEYHRDPQHFSVRKYENPHDTDISTEPLPLAYREMFAAINQGCTVVYGKLDETVLRRELGENNLIQTTIRVDKVYPGNRHVRHSILLYDCVGDIVFFHDPKHGKSLQCRISLLLHALPRVGAGIIFHA